MNRKALLIILIVFLAFGMAFAARQGDVKVGAQLGYGWQSLKMTKGSNYCKVSNDGIYVAATGEYNFSPELAGKLEVGINTMGNAKYSYKIGPFTYNDVKSSKTPTHISVYAGAEYGLKLTKKVGLAFGAGADFMIGKEANASDAKTNAAIGLGLEAVGSYALKKNLDITLGVKFGLHFINTDDDIDDFYGSLGDDVKVNNMSYKIFAGATYAL